MTIQYFALVVPAEGENQPQELGKGGGLDRTVESHQPSAPRKLADISIVLPGLTSFGQAPSNHNQTIIITLLVRGQSLSTNLHLKFG